MPNTNCLAGMACPKCGSEGPFDIECTVQYRVYDDGTDEISGDGIGWDATSDCTCTECGLEKTVGYFRTAEPKTEKEKE